ncbi:site-specific integrase [Congregibacter litoralis]|uniref:site-specific integrase n=1 Tax=Congregibacter litoralis TaxID=393662 RepID=UPI0012601AE6|nr:site-specific integrase [Congregibacter litoralis]
MADSNLAEVRREWTRATLELYRYHLGLYRGEPMAGESDYLGQNPNEPAKPTGKEEDIRTLSDWVEPFIANQIESSEAGKDAQDRYRKAVNNFEALLGPVAAPDITGEHVTTFMQDMKRLPAQRNKRKAYRGRSVEDLLASEIPKKDLYSPTTINGFLQALSGLMKWLRESNDAVRINPFDSKKVKPAPKERGSYSDADLERIFTSPVWTPQSSYNLSYGNAAYWWLPLLALFTGARRSELVQMPLERVREIEGVLCLDLVGAQQEGLQLKTAAAERRIPVHPELIRLGFEDYVEALRADGATRLLEAFPLGANGRGSKASDWYSRYRDRNFPDFAEQFKDFHSYRTTHGTQAKTCGISPMLMKQWFGHTDAGKEDVLERNYNTGQPIRMLYDELSKLSWEVKALQDLPQGWRELPIKQRREQSTGG